jgi:hypothetical protein
VSTRVSFARAASNSWAAVFKPAKVFQKQTTTETEITFGARLSFGKAAEAPEGVRHAAHPGAFQIQISTPQLGAAFTFT